MRGRTFKGGYRFGRFEGEPRGEIAAQEIPRRALIPLCHGSDTPLEPTVKVGDDVRAGQVIARDDTTLSSPVHASITGKVTNIERMNHFNRDIPMVFVEGDGTESYEKLEGHSADWEGMPLRRLEELLYASGVTSLGREGIPTHFRTSVITPEQVDHVIVEGTDSEVYNLSLELLLRDDGLSGFASGLGILAKLAPQAEIILALNAEKRSLLEAVRQATAPLDRIRIQPVVPKYPQGRSEILVSTVLGRNLPHGSSATAIGTVILDVQAVLQVFEAVVRGKPLIERLIALCGTSFRENVHVKVRLGTPLQFVLKDRLEAPFSRIVLNSPITGEEIMNPFLPVDGRFSEIIAIPEGEEREFLAFLRPGLKKDSCSRAFLSSFLFFLGAKKTIDTNLHGEPRPCIQCGYCAEVCPARLIPALLHRNAQSRIDDVLMRYGILDCIDCGLCSYVCPCKIPLAGRLVEAKAKLTV